MRRQVSAAAAENTLRKKRRRWAHEAEEGPDVALSEGDAHVREESPGREQARQRQSNVLGDLRFVDRARVLQARQFGLQAELVRHCIGLEPTVGVAFTRSAQL